MSRKLDYLANRITAALKEQGAIVQRYDAITSNSIYLKVDYGVSHSIRISDHTGKRHLSYRYNLVKGCTEHVSKTSAGWERYYYPLRRVDELIVKVLEDRQFRISCFGERRYKQSMNENQQIFGTSAGFWRNAKLV